MVVEEPDSPISRLYHLDIGTLAACLESTGPGLHGCCSRCRRHMIIGTFGLVVILLSANSDSVDVCHRIIDTAAWGNESCVFIPIIGMDVAVVPIDAPFSTLSAHM